MSISVAFLAKVIIVLLLILLLLSIYTVIQQLRETDEKSKISRYIEENQTKWYEYFTGDDSLPQGLIPENDLEIQGIEEIFLSYIQNLSDRNIIGKIKDFSNRYLAAYYFKLLKHRKWSIRMNAIYRMSDFQIDSLVDRLLKESQLWKRTKITQDVHFQLLAIHAQFRPEIFIEKLLAEPMQHSEYEYKLLLIGIDSPVLNRLAQKMDKLPAEGRHSLIEVMGIRRDPDFLLFLEGNLHHEEAEIRIKSLRAIASIAMVTELGKYEHFLRSPLWVERLMIVKLLRILPADERYSYLETLLEDENWQVRDQAASLIANNGMESLVIS